MQLVVFLKIRVKVIKKNSWYAVNTLKNTMKGYSFNKVNKNDNIYIFEYKNNDNQLMYVIWSPTEEDKIIKKYKFTLNNLDSALVTEIKDKQELGYE
jgi:hypothetical protein